MAASVTLEKGNFGNPDDTRPFGHGKMEVVQLATRPLGAARSRLVGVGRRM
jgi:hypothetical protein